MPEPERNRFFKYLPLLLDALRSSHPTPMRPAEARAWIRSNIDVPQQDTTRLIAGGTQSIFENDVHWARFYLAKAELIDSPKWGYWGLTDEGLVRHLTPEETLTLVVRVREAQRFGSMKREEESTAPGAPSEDDEEVDYWFASIKGGEDQLARFHSEGTWETEYPDQLSTLVLRMRPGDRIALKSNFVQKTGLPFENNSKIVAVMRILATGTILENPNNGTWVKVMWDAPSKPRDWYFYTYLARLVQANKEDANGDRLIAFAFRNEHQNYAWFLEQPYWARKYGVRTDIKSLETAAEIRQDEVVDLGDQPVYTVKDVVEEGCFLEEEEIEKILAIWKSKKNLVLQGPPGTGKTWLAKLLGFVLVGSRDRETTRSRVRIVQFHPSLAYEDFVRGWRPTGEGKLALVDGILMQAIEAAASEPSPFVLVIEEINRGNPAQIFGEMLTLLEDSKRHAAEAIELAYHRSPGERVHVPGNLYIIGTMNVADRSLAMVDLALRRRFAFYDLEPQLSRPWWEWCKRRGLDEQLLDEIRKRVTALNSEISSAPSLGRQFRIGHSFVTPNADEMVTEGLVWFRMKVEAEIGPLLDEYWCESPENAKRARSALLEGLS